MQRKLVYRVGETEIRVWKGEKLKSMRQSAREKKTELSDEKDVRNLYQSSESWLNSKIPQSWSQSNYNENNKYEVAVS